MNASVRGGSAGPPHETSGALEGDRCAPDPAAADHDSERQAESAGLVLDRLRRAAAARDDSAPALP